MDKHEQIRQGLAALAKRFGPQGTLLATVQSVDETEMTCTLFDDDIEIYDVRLRPVLNGNESLTLFPKVGSYVLAVKIEDTEEWMVIACDEIDKWRLVIGETVIEQSSEGLLIKKQEDTLKEVIQLIIEAVQQIVVLQGTNPDYVKLTQALSKAQNILR